MEPCGKSNIKHHTSPRTTKTRLIIVQKLVIISLSSSQPAGNSLMSAIISILVQLNAIAVELDTKSCNYSDHFKQACLWYIHQELAHYEGPPRWRHCLHKTHSCAEIDLVQHRRMGQTLFGIHLTHQHTRFFFLLKKRVF